jgi:transcription elongation factor Elf1
MSEAENIWSRKADEEVLLAVSSLSDYTEEGQRVVLAEAERRGFNVASIARAKDALSAAIPEGAARCAYCDTRIFFGGKREGQLIFCSEACRQAGIRLAVSHQVPDRVVTERLEAVFNGRCPRCGGPGPVDVHTSHRVYSALVVTSWNSRVAVVCTPCGRRAKVGDAIRSFALWWWGLPCGSS